MGFFGKCDGYCSPFMIYVFLVLVSVVGQFVRYFLTNQVKSLTKQQKAKAILAHILMSGVFAFTLYTLCTHCYNKTAWFLFILPVILALLIVATTVVVTENFYKKR